MVRQALFNILGQIEGKEFLDLFAGTGKIGTEAFKKGAKSVILVERDRHICKSIRDTIPKDEKLKVICSDALSFLKRNKGKFDIIFADPPYDYKAYDRLINLAIANLKQDGVFILEHRKDKNFEADDKRVYGDTAISFWRKE
ncbi:MAG: methyltransferase [Aquificae bacterium]|nr:methyltransferase [Aquificota bacterium]